MINFNIPPCTGTEIKYLTQAIENHRISGDGPFTRKCSEWMEEKLPAEKVLLTTSGSSALDMAALLCGIRPGDEVILPSFTFSSTANAFVLAGAKLVFADIRPDTMNLDETRLEEAITDRTKVIVPVHYAGVACNMDAIMSIARRYGLLVVEDAAQAFGSTFHGKSLGTFGDFGCLSFHETKNLSMGEGGAIIINDKRFTEKAEILREKGTNRSSFKRGETEKYTWIDFGDSYLPGELNAAYLWAQLQMAEEITRSRTASWERYYNALLPLEKAGKVTLPSVPEGCVHNGHIFYLKCRDIRERAAYIEYMKNNDIQCVFHYIPLHSAPAGLKFGRFSGEDICTTSESEKLVRLPLYYRLSPEDQDLVIEKTCRFFL